MISCYMSLSLSLSLARKGVFSMYGEESWNRQQEESGHRERCILTGDRLASVNGKTNREDEGMRMQRNAWLDRGPLKAPCNVRIYLYLFLFVV